MWEKPKSLARWVLFHPVRLAAVSLFLLYWAAAVFLPVSVVGELVNGVRFSVATSVAIYYAPAAWVAVRKKDMGQTDQLVVGIFATWVATSAIAFWSTAGRLLDYETSVVDSPMTASLLFLVSYGGMLHLTAPGIIEGRIPLGNWRLVAIAVGIGCLLGITLIGISLGNMQ